MLLTFALCMKTSRICTKKCYRALCNDRLGYIALPQRVTYPAFNRGVMQQPCFSNLLLKASKGIIMEENTVVVFSLFCALRCWTQAQMDCISE